MRRLIRKATSAARRQPAFLCGSLILICWATVFTPAQDQASPKPEDLVRIVGAFANVRHTREDAFGYALQLWQQGDQLFGLLNVYTGAPSDPPAGLLEDVKFDPRTRRLSFSARLSTGLTYGGKYSGVPSRDRFTFNGVLTKTEVSGVMQQANELFPNERPTSKRIRLRRSASYTQMMTPAPPTYSAWKTWADEMLKFRGPKW